MAITHDQSPPPFLPPEDQNVAAAPGGTAHASATSPFAGDPPRLVVCLDITAVDFPEGTTNKDDPALANHTLDIDSAESIERVLTYIDGRLHDATGLEKAWTGPAGQLDGWGDKPEEETWAKAFSEVFFGLRYGGPGQAYFGDGKWDSYIFSRLQKKSVNYLDPNLYGIVFKPPLKKPRSGTPPATFLEIQQLAFDLKQKGKTIAEEMTFENNDPAVSIATACQHAATYCMLSRGFTLEEHLDGSNLAAVQNDIKAIFRKPQTEPDPFPEARWYPTNYDHLTVKVATALAQPVGPGSIYCYNPFGDDKLFLVFVPVHWTYKNSEGKLIVSPEYAAHVADVRFEKHATHSEPSELVTDNNSSTVELWNKSVVDGNPTTVPAYLPAQGQKKGSHVFSVLRVSTDKSRIQRFDTANTGKRGDGTVIMSMIPGSGGIYDSEAQDGVSPTAGFGTTGKYCGLGVLGPAPAENLTEQAKFLRRARPIGLLRMVITERVPANQMSDKNLLFVSRMLRMYGEGADDNFWVSKCAWSLRNTPGFSSIQPWWVIYTPRLELAERMWEHGARQASLQSLEPKVTIARQANFESVTAKRLREGKKPHAKPTPGLHYRQDFLATIVLTSNERGQAVYWCRQRSNLSFGNTTDGFEGAAIPKAIRDVVAPQRASFAHKHTQRLMNEVPWNGEVASDRYTDPDSRDVKIKVPVFFRDGQADAISPPSASENGSADSAGGEK